MATIQNHPISVILDCDCITVLCERCIAGHVIPAMFTTTISVEIMNRRVASWLQIDALPRCECSWGLMNSRRLEFNRHNLPKQIGM